MTKKATPVLQLIKTRTAPHLAHTPALGIVPVDLHKEHLVRIGASYLIKTIVGRQ